MCGIVGYIGKEQAAPIILDGLLKLEYRGYDSSGIAIMNGNTIHVKKAAGRLKVLCDLTKGGDIIRSNTYEAFLPLIAVAIIYLLLVMMLSSVVNKLERKLRNNER